MALHFLKTLHSVFFTDCPYSTATFPSRPHSDSSSSFRAEAISNRETDFSGFLLSDTVHDNIIQTG